MESRPFDISFEEKYTTAERKKQGYACNHRWQVARNRTLPPVPLPFQGRGNELRKVDKKNKFQSETR